MITENNNKGSNMLDAIKFLIQQISAFFKILPAAFVIYWNAFVATVPVLTMILAFVYIVLQIAYLVWKWRKEYKDIETNKKE